MTSRYHFLSVSLDRPPHHWNFSVNQGVQGGLLLLGEGRFGFHENVSQAHQPVDRGWSRGNSAPRGSGASGRGSSGWQGWRIAKRAEIHILGESRNCHQN